MSVGPKPIVMLLPSWGEVPDLSTATRFAVGVDLLVARISRLYYRRPLNMTRGAEYRSTPPYSSHNSSGKVVFGVLRKDVGVLATCCLFCAYPWKDLKKLPMVYGLSPMAMSLSMRETDDEHKTCTYKKMGDVVSSTAFSQERVYDAIRKSVRIFEKCTFNVFGHPTYGYWIWVDDKTTRFHHTAVTDPCRLQFMLARF